MDLIAVTIARPANTTAYAANDAVAAASADALEFAFQTTRRTGYIVSARVVTNKAAWTPRLRLHLFREEPTAIADNSPLTLLWANRSSYLGSITFPALATAGGGSDCAVAEGDFTPIAFKGVDGAGTFELTLYGLLEILDSATPDSGQSLLVELGVDG